MATPLDGFYTTTQAADVLGVTDGRIRQFLLEGRLRGEKLPLGEDEEHHPWLIPKAELRRFQKVDRPTGRPPTDDPA